MVLDRSAILAASDLPRELVKVPEWGGDVYVKTMSGAERDAFEAAHTRAPGVNIRARLAAATLAGEDGRPLFTLADTEILGALSAKALDRVFSVAIRLNKISKADVDELEKN